MGKQKKRRLKLHRSAESKKESAAVVTLENNSSTSVPNPIDIKQNVFGEVDIATLLKGDSSKTDDTLSMRSYISNKSIRGERVITKKEKLKLRKKILLKKIDTVNQYKKDKIHQKKNRMSPIIGDTKPLLDNLPSLEPLFKLTDKAKSNHMRKPKKKAIEKSKNIQKNVIKNISAYKKLLKNSSLATNPFEAVSEHLKAVVEQERKLAQNSN